MLSGGSGGFKAKPAPKRKAQQQQEDVSDPPEDDTGRYQVYSRDKFVGRGGNKGGYGKASQQQQQRRGFRGRLATRRDYLDRYDNQVKYAAENERKFKYAEQESKKVELKFNLPEDTRISKLLRRLSVEEEPENSMQISRKLLEVLLLPENGAYVKKSFNILRDSILQILYVAPGLQAKKQCAKAFGRMGYILAQDSYDFSKYLKVILKPKIIEEETVCLYMESLKETLKLDREKPILDKNSVYYLINDLINLIENTDNVEIFQAVLTNLIDCVESHPSDFFEFFKDTMDLLFGWHVDHTQPLSNIEFISASLRRLSEHFQMNLDFSLSLIMNFVEDIETYDDVDHVTVFVLALNTVLQCLNKGDREKNSEIFSAKLITDALTKIVSILTSFLECSTPENLIIACNKTLCLLLELLGTKNLTLVERILKLVDLELAAIRDLNNPGIISILLAVSKIIKELSANLPIDLIGKLVGPDSELIKLRTSPYAEIQDATICVYQALLNLKNIPLLQEAYKYVLSDLEVAFKVVNPDIGSLTMSLKEIEGIGSNFTLEAQNYGLDSVSNLSSGYVSGVQQLSSFNSNNLSVEPGSYNPSLKSNIISNLDSSSNFSFNLSNFITQDSTLNLDRSYSDSINLNPSVRGPPGLSCNYNLIGQDNFNQDLSNSNFNSELESSNISVLKEEGIGDCENLEADEKFVDYARTNLNNAQIIRGGESEAGDSIAMRNPLSVNFHPNILEPAFNNSSLNHVSGSLLTSKLNTQDVLASILGNQEKPSAQDLTAREMRVLSLKYGKNVNKDDPNSNPLEERDLSSKLYKEDDITSRFNRKNREDAVEAKLNADEAAKFSKLNVESRDFISKLDVNPRADSTKLNVETRYANAGASEDTKPSDSDWMNLYRMKVLGMYLSQSESQNPFASLSYDPEEAGVVSLFLLRCLSQLANASGSIIGMWALKPSILELLGVLLQPHSEKLKKIPGLQFGLIFLLYSHCKCYNFFVSSSDLVRQKPNFAPDNTNPLKSPNSGNFSIILDVLHKILKRSSDPEILLLVLRWTREIFAVSEPYLEILHANRQFLKIVKVMIEKCGYSKDDNVVLRVGGNLERLLSDKRLSWKNCLLKKVNELCVLRMGAGRGDIREIFARLLANISWDVSVLEIGKLHERERELGGEEKEGSDPEDDLEEEYFDIEGAGGKSLLENLYKIPDISKKIALSKKKGDEGNAEEIKNQIAQKANDKSNPVESAEMNESSEKVVSKERTSSLSQQMQSLKEFHAVSTLAKLQQEAAKVLEGSSTCSPEQLSRLQDFSKQLNQLQSLPLSSQQFQTFVDLLQGFPQQQQQLLENPRYLQQLQDFSNQLNQQLQGLPSTSQQLKNFWQQLEQLQTPPRLPQASNFAQQLSQLQLNPEQLQTLARHVYANSQLRKIFGVKRPRFTTRGSGGGVVITKGSDGGDLKEYSAASIFRAQQLHINGVIYGEILPHHFAVFMDYLLKNPDAKNLQLENKKGSNEAGKKIEGKGVKTIYITAEGAKTTTNTKNPLKNTSDPLSFLRGIFSSSWPLESESQDLSDEFREICLSSQEVLENWITWEAAQYCVNNKLRTTLGKPNETFTSFENCLKRLAKEIMTAKRREPLHQNESEIINQDEKGITRVVDEIAKGGVNVGDESKKEGENAIAKVGDGNREGGNVICKAEGGSKKGGGIAIARAEDESFSKISDENKREGENAIAKAQEENKRKGGIAITKAEDEDKRKGGNAIAKAGEANIDGENVVSKAECENKRGGGIMIAKAEGENKRGEGIVIAKAEGENKRGGGFATAKAEDESKKGEVDEISKLEESARVEKDISKKINRGKDEANPEDVSEMKLLKENKDHGKNSGKPERIIIMEKDGTKIISEIDETVRKLTKDEDLIETAISTLEISKAESSKIEESVEGLQISEDSEVSDSTSGDSSEEAGKSLPRKRNEAEATTKSAKQKKKSCKRLIEEREKKDCEENRQNEFAVEESSSLIEDEKQKERDLKKRQSIKILQHAKESNSEECELDKKTLQQSEEDSTERKGMQCKKDSKEEKGIFHQSEEGKGMLHQSGEELTEGKGNLHQSEKDSRKEKLHQSEEDSTEGKGKLQQCKENSREEKIMLQQCEEDSKEGKGKLHQYKENSREEKIMLHKCEEDCKEGNGKLHQYKEYSREEKIMLHRCEEDSKEGKGKLHQSEKVSMERKLHCEEDSVERKVDREEDSTEEKGMLQQCEEDSTEEKSEENSTEGKSMLRQYEEDEEGLKGGIKAKNAKAQKEKKNTAKKSALESDENEKDSVGEKKKKKKLPSGIEGEENKKKQMLSSDIEEEGKKKKRMPTSGSEEEENKKKQMLSSDIEEEGKKKKQLPPSGIEEEEKKKKQMLSSDIEEGKKKKIMPPSGIEEEEKKKKQMLSSDIEEEGKKKKIMPPSGIEGEEKKKKQMLSSDSEEEDDRNVINDEIIERKEESALLDVSVKKVRILQQKNREEEVERQTKGVRIERNDEEGQVETVLGDEEEGEAQRKVKIQQREKVEGKEQLKEGKAEKKEKDSIKIQQNENDPVTNEEDPVKILQKDKDSVKIQQKGKDSVNDSVKIQQKGKDSVNDSVKIQQKGKDSVNDSVKIQQKGNDSVNDSVKIQQKGKDSVKIQQNEKDSVKIQNNEPVKNQQKDKESAKIQQKDEESIKIQQDEKESIKIQQDENESIKIQQKEMDKIQQKEKDSIKIQRNENAPVMIKQNEKDSVKIQQKEIDSVKIQQKGNDSVRIQQREKDSVKVQQNEMDSVKIQQKEIDSIKIQQKENDSVRIQQKDKDSVKIQQKENESDKSQQKERELDKIQQKENDQRNEKESINIQQNERESIKIQQNEKESIKIQKNERESIQQNEKEPPVKIQQKEVKVLQKDKQVKIQQKEEPHQKDDPKQKDEDYARNQKNDFQQKELKAKSAYKAFPGMEEHDPNRVDIKRVHLLLTFIDHLEKLIHNAAEGSALAIPQPPKPVRTFFTTNSQTCKDWLTRIRIILIQLALHAGQNVLALRHGQELIKDFVSNNKQESVDFERVVMYVTLALLNLKESEAIFGLYVFCKTTAKKKLEWIKAASEQALNKYELAAAAYQRILAEINADVYVQNFISDQIINCYKELNDWKAIMDYKNGNMNLLFAESENGLRYSFNTVDFVCAKALKDFEKHDWDDLDYLEKIEANYDLENIERLSSPRAFNELSSWRELSKSSSWSVYDALRITETNLYDIALSMKNPLINVRDENNSAGAFSKKENLLRKLGEIQLEHENEISSRIEDTSRKIRLFMQDNITRLPSLFLKDFSLLNYVADGLKNVAERKPASVVFLVSEDFEKEVDEIDSSTLMKILWWSEYFARVQDQHRGFSTFSSNLRLNIIKKARKESNYDLATVQLYKFLNDKGLLDANINWGVNKKSRLVDLAESFKNKIPGINLWSLDTAKAAQEMIKLLCDERNEGGNRKKSRCDSGGEWRAKDGRFCDEDNWKFHSKDDFLEHSARRSSLNREDFHAGETDRRCRSEEKETRNFYTRRISEGSENYKKLAFDLCAISTTSISKCADIYGGIELKQVSSKILLKLAGWLQNNNNEVPLTEINTPLGKFLSVLPEIGTEIASGHAKYNTSYLNSKNKIRMGFGNKISENYGRFNIGENLIPINEMMIGKLLQFSVNQCQNLAKNWNAFGTWCYRWGKKIVDNSSDLTNTLTEEDKAVIKSAVPRDCTEEEFRMILVILSQTRTHADDEDIDNNEVKTSEMIRNQLKNVPVLSRRRNRGDENDSFNNPEGFKEKTETTHTPEELKTLGRTAVEDLQIFNKEIEGTPQISISVPDDLQKLGKEGNEEERSPLFATSKNLENPEMKDPAIWNSEISALPQDLHGFWKTDAGVEARTSGYSDEENLQNWRRSTGFWKEDEQVFWDNRNCWNTEKLNCWKDITPSTSSLNHWNKEDSASIYWRNQEEGLSSYWKEGLPSTSNQSNWKPVDLASNQLKNLNMDQISRTPEDTIDHLVQIWKNLQKRIYAYYGLSVEAYFKYLHLTSNTENTTKATEANTVTVTLRLLRLIVKHALELQNCLEEGLSSSPTQPWKIIIPQLFSRLNHPESFVRERVSELLCRVAEDSPHLITFPAVVGALEGGVKFDFSEISLPKNCLSQKNEEGKKDEEEDEEDEDDEEVYESDDDCKDILQSCFKSMVETLSKKTPETISQVKLLVKELRRIILLWDELWLGTLAQHHGEIQKRQQQLELEIEKVNANKNLSPEEKISLITEKHRIILKPIVFVLEQLNGITSAEPETPHEKQFQERFSKTISEVLVKLKNPENPERPQESWKLLKDLQNQFQQKSHKSRNLLKMQEISPVLSNITDTLISMPGQTLRKKVYIQKVSSQVSILPTKTKPKKLIFYGSDGKTYTYLFKGLEDLHLDERIMQFLSITNKLLAQNSEGTGHNLYRARHYSVIPLGPRSGLISWVSGTTPVFSLYKRWQQREAQKLNTTKNPQIPRPSELFYNKLNPLLQEQGVKNTENRKEWPLVVLKQVLVELTAETPGDLLSKELWLNSVNPKNYWQVVKKYNYSVAVMSIIGYVIGLGDRHLDNVLVDLSTGEVVHIDYNVCFEKGKTLRVPEKVPFRLTPNIRDALGVTGIEGMFRLSCEHILKTMKKGRETLLTLLEAFVYDPLVDWTVGNDGLVGTTFGGISANAATHKKQTRKDLEKEVTLAMYRVRCTEMKTEWEQNRDDILKKIPHLKELLHAWLDDHEKSTQTEDLLQDLHQQMALVKEAEANGICKDSLHTLPARFETFRQQRESAKTAKKELEALLKDSESHLEKFSECVKYLQSQQLQAWFVELSKNGEKERVFELVKEFLQNAGQAGMVQQCDVSESEVAGLQEQQNLAAAKCLNLLQEYWMVYSQSPQSYLENHRLFHYIKWLTVLKNSSGDFQACENVLQQFYAFANQANISKQSAGSVLKFSYLLNILYNQALAQAQKAFEELSKIRLEEPILVLEKHYADSKMCLANYLRHEKNGAKALEFVILSELLVLNRTFLTLETAASKSGDWLIKLTSREGDWFLDELTLNSSKAIELIGYLSIEDDVELVRVSEGLHAANNVYKALHELNFNFHTIILPESMKKIQSEERSVVEMVAELGAVIRGLGVPLQELVVQLEKELTCVIMEMDHSPSYEMIQTKLATLKRQYQSLLAHSDPAEEALTPGKMLLMGFNGLFEKLNLESNNVINALSQLQIPPCWRKLDQVKDAKSLTAPIFNRDVKKIIEDVFLLKRVNAMYEVFAMCTEMCKSFQKGQDFNFAKNLISDQQESVVVFNDEQLVKPIRKYIADFISRQFLGVTTEAIAYVTCFLLQRLGLNVTKEIEQKDIGAENKVPLEELYHKGWNLFIKNGLFNQNILAETSTIESNVKSAWEKIQKPRMLEKTVALTQSSVQRLQNQLSAHFWIHEDLLTLAQNQESKNGFLRSKFLTDLHNKTNNLKTLQAKNAESREKQRILIAGITQRLKWAAGANPDLNEILSAFEASLRARDSQLEIEQRITETTLRTSLTVLKHEILRNGSPEAKGYDQLFLASYQKWIQAFQFSNLTKIENVSKVEENIMRLYTKDLINNPKWIKVIAEKISDIIKVTQKESSDYKQRLDASRSTILSSFIELKSAHSEHCAVMSDFKNLIKSLSKIEPAALKAQQFISSYREYIERFSALIQRFKPSNSAMKVSDVEASLGDLDFLAEATGDLYAGLLELEGRRCFAGGGVENRRRLVRQDGVSLSPARVLRGDLKQQESMTRGQQRNAYAVNVWRRIRAKLEGRDPDPGRRYTTQEQVDYVIREATSLDNLCLLYEGWTPWV